MRLQRTSVRDGATCRRTAGGSAPLVGIGSHHPTHDPDRHPACHPAQGTVASRQEQDAHTCELPRGRVADGSASQVSRASLLQVVQQTGTIMDGSAREMTHAWRSSDHSDKASKSRAGSRPLRIGRAS